MAGHAWRWVLVSLLVLSACGRSNSTDDDPALGGQPGTGGVRSTAGSAGEGGDSRGGTAPSVGGNANGGAQGGAPTLAEGGAAEAGAGAGGETLGGASSGGVSSGGASSGGVSSGGAQGEGGRSAELPIDYETCCYIGGYVRVFVTKFDPNSRLCVNVAFIQGTTPSQPTGVESEITIPEGFWLERAVASYLEPGQSCSRQLHSQNSHEARSARGTVSWDSASNCHDGGVSGEMSFTFVDIEGEQTLSFDDHEQSCL